MATISPYLNFDGNTEEVFTFYKSVFGGEFLALARFKEMPDAGNIPEMERDRIMHISLPIGKGSVLMASDILPSMGHKLASGNNFYVSIHPESKEEAERLFNGLSAGGKIEMPLQDAFWGSYFGMFTDRFGIQWMVNFDYSQQQ